jgi:hypothetical protein
MIANFDDREPLPLVSQVNPVALYQGIDYKSFNIIKTGLPVLLPGLPPLPPVFGILPQSGDIMIANSVTGTTLTGAPALYAATITSFGLEELYFGCTLNTILSFASLPVPCTIAFTGIKNGDDARRTTVNIRFNPQNPLKSSLGKATFEGEEWTDLTKLKLAVVQSTPTATLTGLFIDSIKYRNCTEPVSE